MIETEVFKERMEKHWTDKLGNVPNDPLRETWGQIAKTLNRQIKYHDDSDLSTNWSVLQPPTGSGKTQSVILYSGMVSTLEDHPGILIVTRRIADCEQIVEQINQLADLEDYAVAYHSEAKVKPDDLKIYPVVVITHKAYENALDYLGDRATIKNTWPFFHTWGIGTRKLVVIDESIDVVESNQAGLDGLRETLGAIPEKVRVKHPDEIGMIQGIISVFEEAAKRTKQSAKDAMVIKDIEAVIQKGTNVPDLEAFIEKATDLNGLIGALSEIKFNPKDPFENERLRKKHERRLKDLQHVMRSWTYYSGQNNDHTFHTARLLIPEDVKGAVVLDATASTNVIHELHQDSSVVTAPEGTRDYSNVTLHISRGHKVGKTYMNQNAKTVTKELMSELNSKLTEDTLVITHKNVEPHLKKYETSFPMHTGHWGTIDGSNEWKDCSNVVIFGLPYRPDYWTSDVFMALQGPTDTEWLRDPNKRSFKSPDRRHSDIRKSLMDGQIATDVIQGINRVKCRKTIDSQGNCEQTDVYIMLPKDTLADVLVESIKRLMPGIKVKEWEYTGQTKKPKASKHEQSLMKYIENMGSGRRKALGHIGKVLGIAPRTRERLTSKMKDPESGISKTMTECNVVLQAERKGKSTKNYLIKD